MTEPLPLVSQSEVAVLSSAVLGAIKTWAFVFSLQGSPEPGGIAKDVVAQGCGIPAGIGDDGF